MESIVANQLGNPAIAGFVVNSRDITDRRRAEESLRQRDGELEQTNAELRRATRLKDEFLAGMSHELRTPLNAILTLAEVLQEETYGPLTPKQANSLRTIERSGQHLLELIGDILDLSKIESGKLHLVWETVSAARICEESLCLVREAAFRKRLSLSLSGAEPDLSFRGDARRLRQILINLLSNAVKFTPEDGVVRLDVARSEDGQAVLFHVVDSGIGIREEDLPRLFKPFIQLDSSLSRRYAGTGLGLSLVGRLVRLHQGSVTVQSTPGQGSRFTVTLPIGSETEEPPHPAPALPPIPTVGTTSEPISSRLRPPLILLADDNELAVGVLVDYLTQRRYQMAVARTGVEAVEKARTLLPDLILMDVQMPELDGLEAIRQLRAAAETQAVPILALTALAMPGDRERCLAAGASEYLSKPVPLKTLLSAINGLLHTAALIPA